MISWLPRGISSIGRIVLFAMEIPLKGKLAGMALILVVIVQHYYRWMEVDRSLSDLAITIFLMSSWRPAVFAT